MEVAPQTTLVAPQTTEEAERTLEPHTTEFPQTTEVAPQTTLLPAKFESSEVLVTETLPFRFKTAVWESATPVARSVLPRAELMSR